MASNPSGNCVEIGTGWRKASRCKQDCCVEVGQGHCAVVVRDTKDEGAGPVLVFTPRQWHAFLRTV